LRADTAEAIPLEIIANETNEMLSYALSELTNRLDGSVFQRYFEFEPNESFRVVDPTIEVADDTR
jgi:hypothetical protein